MSCTKNNDAVGNRVLIIGIYLVDMPNHAITITQSLKNVRAWEIDIRWVAAGCGPTPLLLQPNTIFNTESLIPKFTLLNQIIESLDFNDYQYLIVIDDDIELDKDFLDRFLWIQKSLDLALAQPARTRDSFIDHAFVAQQIGVAARQTRFVEVGPLFSLRQDIYPILLPFNKNAPMGWGLDYCWPALLEEKGYRLGIVDATPVRHKLRKPVSLYDYRKVSEEMEKFLANHVHLTPEEAFVNLKCYPLLNHVPGLALRVREESD